MKISDVEDISYSVEIDNRKVKRGQGFGKQLLVFMLTV